MALFRTLADGACTCRHAAAPPVMLAAATLLRVAVAAAPLQVLGVEKRPSIAAPFSFVATLRVPLANTTRCCPVPTQGREETRGFHYVLAASNSGQVFGCGIDGQLVAVDFATAAQPVLQQMLDGEQLVQSRAMVWDSSGKRLVVANRDFLFYALGEERTGPAPTSQTIMTLVANVSTAMTGRASRGNTGTMGGENSSVCQCHHC